MEMIGMIAMRLTSVITSTELLRGKFQKRLNHSLHSIITRRSNIAPSRTHLGVQSENGQIAPAMAAEISRRLNPDSGALIRSQRRIAKSGTGTRTPWIRRPIVQE